MFNRQRILIALCAALSALSIYLAYALIDQTTLLNYARDEREDMRGQREIVGALALNLAENANRSTIKNFLSSRYSNVYLNKPTLDGNDVSFVDSIAFRFRGDKLVAIDFDAAVPSRLRHR